jgi:hypothetical protein
MEQERTRGATMMALASKSLEARIKPDPEHYHIFVEQGARVKSSDVD